MVTRSKQSFVIARVHVTKMKDTFVKEKQMATGVISVKRLNTFLRQIMFTEKKCVPCKALHTLQEARHSRAK